MNKFIFFLLLIAAAVRLPAQDSTLIPRDHFFHPEDIHQLHLASGGERVYYQRRSAGARKLFYITPEAPGDERALSMPGELIDWVPTHEGQLLLHLRDENRRPRLLLAGADGAVLRDLTPFPLRLLRLEALSRQRSDAAAVWVVAEDPDRDGVYVIDLKKGTNLRVSPRLGYEARYYDGQLQPVAARRPNGAGGQTLFVKRKGEWRPLADFPADEGRFIGGFQHVLSVSEDGERVYFLDNLEKDKTVLMEYHLPKDSLRVLAADSHVDLLTTGAVVGGDGWPQMVQGIWAGPRRHYLNGETRQDLEWLDTQLGAPAGFVDRSADGRTWLMRKADGRPDRYYLLRRPKRELIPLFTAYPPFAAVELADRHSFSVRTQDGLELPVQVFLAPGLDKDRNGVPDTLLPTVLFVHDGPRDGVTHWDDWSQNRHLQLLASRGYAVVRAEFRGVAGQGREKARLGDRQWGGTMHRDLVEVATWAVREKIAAVERIAIFGYGFGGYSATAALALTPGRFACGLAVYAPTDLEAFMSQPRPDSTYWWTVVGDPRTPAGAEQLRKQSPRHLVGRIEKPLLLATGAKDEPALKTQTDAFARALDEAGKEVVYFYYPDENPDIQSAQTWVSFWAIAEKFLHNHLGGRFQPPGPDPERGKPVVVYGKEYVEGME